MKRKRAGALVFSLGWMLFRGALLIGRLPGVPPGNATGKRLLPADNPTTHQRLQAAEGFALGPVFVCGMNGIVPSSRYSNSSIATDRRYSPPPGSSAL